MNSRTLLIGLALAWALIASLVALSGGPSRAPAGAVPIVVFGLSIVAVVVAKRVPAVRNAIRGTSTRALLRVHLVRFVGIAFLWLNARGQLPVEFAQRAGWGDIAAAVGAIVLLLWPAGVSFRRGLFVWNGLAALDLFVAVGTATWLNQTRPGSMATMLTLPFALVPLWIVPILFMTHAELLRRVRQNGRAVADATPSAIEVGGIEERRS
jgi:hypothetical protein